MSLIQRQPTRLMPEEKCSCDTLVLTKISSPAKSAHLLSSVSLPLEVDLTCNVFSSSHNFQLGANAPGVNSTAGARAAVHLAISESVRIARCSHRTGLCLPVLVRRVGQREQEAPRDVTSPRQTACQRESPAPQPERWHRDRHILHLAALSGAKYITVCGKVKQQLRGNVRADCRVMSDRGSKSEAELDVDVRLVAVIIRCYSVIFGDRDNRGPLSQR